MVELNLNQAGLLSATVTAGLLLVFSLVVGALCRFKGPGRWYAVFGVGFSLTAGLGNISPAFFDIDVDGVTQIPSSSGPDAAAYWLSFAFLLGATLACGLWLWGVIRLLDHYGGRPFRWMGWTAAAIGITVSLPSLTEPLAFVADARYTWLVDINALAFQFPVWWMGAAGWILARARSQEWKSGQAILASALSAYPISYAIWSAVVSAPAYPLYAFAAFCLALGSFLAVQIGWLHRRAKGGGREAIAVTVVADLFLLLGIGMALFLPTESPSSIARIYDVVLVAYAILRLQYLDLDVKVRFGISKGTLAGFIVAVVFICSEGAQSLFGEDKEWLGLLVGGSVVFAIAPLQRAADRLAEKAVPMQAAPATKSTAAIYKEQVETAWMDGRISANEKVMLRKLRATLGLAQEAAEAIEFEVEQAAAGIAR